MKLKTEFQDENFRKGEVADVSIATMPDGRIVARAKAKSGGEHTFYYDCIEALYNDWSDYEEPKKYYYLDYGGRIKAMNDANDEEDMARKAIGNYFETKEEAEKAVEKLKAWHKLIGYWETEILGWEIRDMPTGGNWQTVNVKFNIKARKELNRLYEPMELLDLLFGGEE